MVNIWKEMKEVERKKESLKMSQHKKVLIYKLNQVSRVFSRLHYISTPVHSNYILKGNLYFLLHYFTALVTFKIKSLHTKQITSMMHFF